MNVTNFRYLAHGTVTDYMYDVVRVPMAFTFEVFEMETFFSKNNFEQIYLINSHTLLGGWQIYGDGTASTKDCFKMFNPVDHTTFKVC